jgi:hypothetical protein
MNIYVIQKTGSRKPVYTIRRATWNGTSAPIDGKQYRTQAAAQAAAEALNINVAVIGDIWEIAALMRNAAV